MNTHGQNIIFFGTPPFAVPSLEALAHAGYSLLCVTNPDRPAGRKKALHAPAIKTSAIALNIPIVQPDTLNDDFLSRVQVFHPTVGVVVAYGKILRNNLLSIPEHGFLNIHPSLLPRHRGATPIPATLLAGDAETGVTIMRMDEGVDTGPIVAEERVRLSGTETTGSLDVALSHIGANLLLATLPRYLCGTIMPIAQNNQLATLSSRLHKDDGRLDWHLPAEQIERFVRAYTPQPGAWAVLDSLRWKILSVALADTAHDPPGTIIDCHPFLGVVCGDGRVVHITSIQKEGATPMDGTSAYHGYRRLCGSRFNGTSLA